MANNDLLDSIKRELNVTESELKTLYSASVYAIDYLLKDNASLEIDDFGTFTRRTNDVSSCNIFKPSNRLKERINQQ